MKKIQIIIASEFAIFRNGLKFLIEKESSFNIIGEAANANEIFRLLPLPMPNIIIINLNLKADKLQSLCENLHSRYPKLPILLFVNESLEDSLAELIVRGVRGVIWKDNSGDNLIEVIECVAGGRLYFEDPKNCRVNCHLSQKICENPGIKKLNHNLSERENEVLQLIAKGLTYKQVADMLMISSRTVETHKNNILAKLYLKNKNELVRYAIQNLHM